MNYYIMDRENELDQAHLQFQRLMQSIADVTCVAWADAHSEADRDQVRAFEIDINDAIAVSDIHRRIDGVKQVVEKWGVTLDF